MPNKCAQNGFAAPVLIIVGVIVLLIIVLAATGALKMNFKVSKSGQTPQNQQTSSSSPSSSTPTSSLPKAPELKTYQNKQAGLSFQYSAGWSIKESPAAGIIVALGSPKESEADTFVDNVNVSTADLSSKPEMTLAQIADSWLAQTESSAPSGSFSLLERTSATLSGIPAEKLVYTYSNAQGRNLKGMITIALKDKLAYLITYTAEQNSYANFLDDTASILDSFKLN